jgi:DNA-binding MarR family transcriptional regulator
MRDHVDLVLEQWSRQRPDVDTAGMAIVGRVSRLERVIEPLLAAVFRQHDLEAWEFDLLATLLRSGPPHRLTVSQLIEAAMITSGSMTNRIDRLEGRGLVQRRTHPTDRRVVIVALTRRGRAKVDGALAAHAANEVRMVSGLTAEEQEQLITLLRKLHTSLVAHRETGVTLATRTTP